MNMSRRKANTARIERALVMYDGPQLALLRADTDAVLIGHAVELEPYAFPLICCEPLDRYVNLYLTGKVDLRYVFDATPVSRFYVGDFGGSEKTVKLNKLKKLEEDLLPEKGIFASVHTEPSPSTVPVNLYHQKFLIDGTWEAREFSQLNGKLADAYSLNSIARKLSSGPASLEDEVFLRSAIADREWLGGGSYLSFYGGVKTHRSVHPLKVVGIEYHSPGYVEVAGDKEGLVEVVKAISEVISKHEQIKKVYLSIRKSLQSDGLLKSDRYMDFSADILRDYVEKQSTILANMLMLPNADLLLKASDGNVLVYAKLVSSYYRRIKGLANFYIEGRVQSA